MDGVYIFGLTPISLIGFLFNALVCIALAMNRSLNRIAFYRVTMAYTLNSALISLVASFSPLARSNTHVHVPLVDFFKYEVFNNLVSCLHLMSKTLELLMLCTRLAIFLVSFRHAVDRFAFRHIPFVYVACVLVNLPLFLFDSENTQTTYICPILVLASAFVRDYVTLIGETALGVLLLASFHAFLITKYRMIKNKNIPLSQQNQQKQQQRSRSCRRVVVAITCLTVFSIAVNLAILICYKSVSLSGATHHQSPPLADTQIGTVILILLVAKPFVALTILLNLDKNFQKVFK